MRHIQLTFGMALVAFLLCVLPVSAADVPFAIRQASVIIQCGDKQGSGVVVNGTTGYVLTNAHVLLNETTNRPDRCVLGFVTDQTYLPNVFYRATGIQYVYDAANNRDFAILQIGRLIQGQSLVSFPSVETDEFSKLGDPITLIAYPAETTGTQLISSGTITDFDQGTIRTDAFIGHGSSGGPGVDAQGHLIGIARGIIYADDASQATGQPVGYELVDIRNILTWLETLGSSDTYMTQSDAAQYAAPHAYIVPENLSCTLLAKSVRTSTVYCLKSNGTRAVFPNSATYASWFSDFSGVQTLSAQDLSAYQLTSDVTMKTGTLVKVESDPKVYLVADTSGLLRWIPSETIASRLYGAGWAGFVKDVPATLFTSYHVGDPLPE